uniref:Uncharacterized protein n=1 Tax=viral metagenome TaxID=1070528 RepID=A0A6C0JGP7_9ZZZZ
MAKKCIPGLFCIENMTLFLLVVILVLFMLFYYNHYGKSSSKKNDMPNIVIVNQPPSLAPMSTRLDPMSDAYAPPLKNDSYFPPNFGDIRGAIPVNMETRGLSASYQQVGILNKVNGSSDMILPLMGRRNMRGRDKWQYYTISNTGNLNTKLPVSLNGKSCTTENGCDNISNGDVVYVEGYNDTFRATVYETNTFQYIPVL